MYNVQPLHIFESGEKLPRVSAHRIDLDTALVAVLPQSLPQILVHRLENHAQVVLVIKTRKHVNAVPLVLRVALDQTLQISNLLLPGSSHHLVVALHLDRNFGMLRRRSLAIRAPHHSREDALAEATNNLVALVQDIPNPVCIISLLVVVVIATVHLGCNVDLLWCIRDILHLIAEHVKSTAAVSAPAAVLAATLADVFGYVSHCRSRCRPRFLRRPVCLFRCGLHSLPVL
mmetsp:Transcript_1224/g.2049  ORF Transcript_1224/g.2049 Transcript_1224/m.2049 type:complete len:231 (-) Transcript_1224:982-1674(-)